VAISAQYQDPEFLQKSAGVLIALGAMHLLFLGWLLALQFREPRESAFWISEVRATRFCQDIFRFVKEGEHAPPGGCLLMRHTRCLGAAYKKLWRLPRRRPVSCKSSRHCGYL
jgi:hypothetical protein